MSIEMIVMGILALGLAIVMSYGVYTVVKE
jgi:hypothetical protein